ncbi:hypothetical protein HOY82DRAFT_595163 [Tuber indicum]|nr:hypothetical protein HOY82DRAFT_595163 [Tuber indicum]
MAPVDRSVFRNTFIYTSKNRAEVLRGLWATSSVTNANLYSILEIFSSISGSYYLHDDSELVVGRNGQQLQPGNYYVFTDGRLLCASIIGIYSLWIGSIVVTDEVPLNRQISLQTGTRVGSFRKAVRERDKGSDGHDQIMLELARSQGSLDQIMLDQSIYILAIT